MRNSTPADLPGSRAIFFVLKQSLYAAVLYISCGTHAWADGSSKSGDSRAVLSSLIDESDHNFNSYRREKTATDESGVYFDAKPPSGMVSATQSVALIKGSYYYIADITAPASIQEERAAFFSMPDFHNGRGTYTIVANTEATNAEKEVSNLCLNGRKVATYAKFRNNKEDTLSVGPFVTNMAEMNEPNTTGTPPTDLRAVFADLINESDRNFAKYQGEKAAEDNGGIYYRSKPISGMVSGAQYVALLKGYYFYIADITAASSLQRAREAFFAMPEYKESNATFVLELDKAGSSDKKEVTNLLLNGRKVATYAKYQGGTEDAITVGPFGGRPAAANEAADVDQKAKLFAAGTQILVRAAAGNFSGMAGELVRKTADGDLLYNAVRVPEMQTMDDAQMLMFTENRYFYMNSYDDEPSVAFALSSFLALPNLITQDHAYTVAIDRRLDNQTSMTYHLRYNGEIVADFIKFKTKPKAYVTVGYRDGIPKGLAMSRTYSEAAIAGAKQMVNAATTCQGCHGTGVEEIDTGWAYKNSGIHEKKWGPCHYCHGTGHL